MGKCPVAPIESGMPMWGIYTGDCTAEQKIELGFTPRFLAVWNFAGRQGCINGNTVGDKWNEYDGGACTSDAPQMADALNIVEGGFTVAQDALNHYYTNTKNFRYIYLVFR